MASELRPGRFNMVEPMFLTEKWEAVVLLKETEEKEHKTDGKPKRILHNIGIR